jgi:hypothetical protein
VAAQSIMDGGRRTAGETQSIGSLKIQESKTKEERREEESRRLLNTGSAT